MRDELRARCSSSPGVTISEARGVRYLHLGGSVWIQGAMKLSRPLYPYLEYVQNLFGGLLFCPLSDAREERVLQLGLGAASCTKFSHQVLRLRTRVIEINPAVVAACRQWFALAPHNNASNDERLSVCIEDAQLAMQQGDLQGQVDVLQVDLYDQEAASPVLDDVAFYAACRQALTPKGWMSINLFGRDHCYEASLQKILSAFGPRCVWAFDPTEEGNTVVLAFRSEPDVGPGLGLLEARAQDLHARYALPAMRWPQRLRPCLS